MDFDLLLVNLTNPTLLYFLLGIVAFLVRSDLEIPPSTTKFISLYLLFSIGFRGWQELAHSALTGEIIGSVLFGLGLAAVIPLYTFFILRRKLSVYDAGAVAAAYGSVSAVTLLAAASFLEVQRMEMGMTTAKRFGAFRRYGAFVTVFSILVPIINGCAAAVLSGFITPDPANHFVFAVLAGSATYIAVPAAMRIAAPRADPGLYFPMALGVTFPFNIAVGLPLYWMVVQVS